MSSLRNICVFALVTVLFAAATPASAMGTAFTYQGTLEDGGGPATGSYDFEFRLIDSNGVALATNGRSNVGVVRGVFTVELDFSNSSNPFPGSSERFLEIGIRPSGSSGPYEFLSPLTPINPAPYAQRAAAVTNNSITTESIAPFAVTNSDLASGAVTNVKVAAGTLTMSRLAGVFFNGTIGALTVSGGVCTNFTVPVFGARVGDFPMVALQAGETLPAGMTLTATRVPLNDFMEMRACNVGNSSSSWSQLKLIVKTVR